MMAETFAAVVADRRRFRGRGEQEATAWLYAIARHCYSDWLRHARVERRALARLGLDPPQLTDAQLERIDELAAPRRCVRGWPSSLTRSLRTIAPRCSCGSSTSAPTRTWQPAWASASRPPGRGSRERCARPGLVADIDGAPAWRLERNTLGTREYCARLGDARGPANPVNASTSADVGRASAPTACISRRGRFDWAAQALRLRPGQKGVPGFDRWDYKRRPPRTLLLGVARASGLVTRVTVTGAGAPRELRPAPNGAFALPLPVSVDPKDLRLTVRLKDGTTQRGRSGHGIVEDPVPSRRPR